MINFKKIIDVCKNIPDNKGYHCLQYLIIMVTEPGWQQTFIEDHSSRPAQETAAYVCQQFPDDQLRGQCIRNTIVNLRIRKEWNHISVEKFCLELDPKFKRICSTNIKTK